MLSLSDSSPSPSPSLSSIASFQDETDNRSSSSTRSQSIGSSSLSPPGTNIGLSTYHADLATSPITGGLESYLNSGMMARSTVSRASGGAFSLGSGSSNSSSPSANYTLGRRVTSVDIDGIHDQLSSTHLSPAQLYSTESGRLFHAGKICIVLVGLPARGKTHIAVSLTRYLRWLGVKTHAFHLGDYRRAYLHPNTDVPDDYFLVNASPSTVIMRQQVMAACKQDVFKFFDIDRGQVAIYDAVNPTVAGRKALVKEFNQHGIRTIQIESICNNGNIIKENVRSVKISSPDYVGWQEKDAIEDYLRRINDKIPHYETVEESESAYIKLFNAGERILVNKLNSGYLANRIVFYLMNIHIKAGCVYFARAGPSTEIRPVYKSDPHLSDTGREYAKKLANTLLAHRHAEYEARAAQGYETPERELVVWTSTRVRTTETVSEFANLGYKCYQRPQLSQMHPGMCDGLAPDQIQRQFPEDVVAHEKDPYRHRFPRAESYHDLAVRLEPVILEMERIPNDILIVAHVSVLRVLYGYLMACLPFDIPKLEFDRTEIVEITPSAYQNKVMRIPIEEYYEDQSTNTSLVI
ncbi:6-phosphofructo-2-kinase-domain-containing protein [Dipodascopsis uninucleata]